MNAENTVVTETETVAAEAAEAAEAKKKPALSPAQQDVADLLDALHVLRKNPDGRASQVLREELKKAVAAIGGPVARGNTLFLVQGEELVQIDMTPGTLVRV